MLRSVMTASILLMAACGGGDGSDLGTDAEIAADLWTDIQGYDAWAQADSWPGVQPHGGTHGGASHVQMWFNDIADAAYGDTIPDGGISVKETYDAEDGAALKIFVMQKIDGYDDTNGDWFYARYSTDGTVDTAGADAIGGCAGCHNGGADDGDRLLSVTTDPPTEE